MNDTPEQPILTLAEERALAAERRAKRLEGALARIRTPESREEWAAAFKCGKYDPTLSWRDE